MKTVPAVIKPWHVFTGLLFLLIALASIFPITDNDVWWHLKTGQIIVRSGSIPDRDPFSFTIYGTPWMTYEWLSQVVLYIVYSLAGLSGLTFFKAVVAAVIFMFMTFRARLKSANLLVVWPLYALSFIAMRDGLRERPQLFSYFFTALFPLLLSVPGRRWRYCVPFLQVLWANMHGPAAIVGFGVTAIYAFFDDARPALSRWGLTAATFAAMFVTPHGYHIFGYFFRLFNDGFSRLILEYRPPQLSLPYIPYFLLLAAASLSLPALFKKSKTDVTVVIIAAAASLLAIRNIPLFLILAMPAVAVAVPRRQDNEFLRMPQALAAGTLLFFLFGGLSMAADVTHKYRFGTGDGYRARHAVEFIRRNNVKGNMFNDYDFGGYLIWKLFPDKKVFVDGRLVEYGAEFVERTFYYWKQPVWDAFEKEYGLTAAIVPQERYYNASYLDSRNDWVLVWWDDDALVYLKDTFENRDIIAKYGYRLLKPNSPRQDYLRHYPQQTVLSELDRAIGDSPRSRRARLIRRYIER